MKRALILFPEAERKRVAEAVAAAEAKTSVEIVPVVSTQSGRYDRAEDIFGLLLGSSALAALWLAFQAPTASEWSGTGYVIDWWLALLIVATGFAAGAALASRVGWLRLLLTPRAEVAAEVDRAARQSFYDQRVHHAAGSGALLIYLSLLERRVVVLASETVIAKVGQPVLDKLCVDLRAALRAKPVPDAVAESINAAGAALAAVLPQTSGTARELSDAVMVVD
jgi:putative membrane protein